MQPLAPLPFGIALGVALATLSALCWLAVVILPDAPLAHSWLGLFSTAPVSSIAAGLTAVMVSLVLGIVTGWLTSTIYNGLSVNRR